MRTSLFASCVAVSLLLQAEAAPAADGTQLKRSPPELPSPETVLSDSSRSLGNGFREVARSQVNPPGSFEGIGHFVFVYYKDEELCKCVQNETAISPSGVHSVFANIFNGKPTLFRALSRTREQLTDAFVGYPKSAAWETDHVVITLEKYENGISHISKLTVPL